ncbi:MAG: hypothetical protein U5K37_06260 [Natrialbaceae archaeon]|nr:hypothetical protein [Natrialbaceae archaeon]
MIDAVSRWPRSMDLTDGLLKAMVPVVLIIGLGVLVLIYSGQAASVIAPADMPVGPEYAFGGMVVVFIVFAVGINRVRMSRRTDAWKTVGDAVGLRPTGDAGEGPYASLEGTVAGRRVMARIDRRKVASGGDEGGTTRVDFTIVETEVPRSVDGGLLAGSEDSEVDASIGTLDLSLLLEEIDVAPELTGTTADGLTVAGRPPAAVEAVATGPAGGAIRSLPAVELVTAGDAAGVVTAFAEPYNDQLEGRGSSLVELPIENLVERLPGDETAVTIESKGLVTDEATLERHAEVVVAIAEVLEGDR